MRIEELNTYTAHAIGTDEHRQASVLIPLLEKEDGTHILFQVRSAKLHSQPGDVCFPGGRREGTETAQETAIRETCEELLVTRDQIEILGASDWFCENSRNIFPFVGRLKNYQNTYSPDEVSEVFSVPLEYFLTTEPDRYEIHSQLQFPEDFPFEKIWGGKDYHWHSRKEEILFWEYQGHVIWGLSARLLLGFVDLLRRN